MLSEACGWPADPRPLSPRGPRVAGAREARSPRPEATSISSNGSLIVSVADGSRFVFAVNVLAFWNLFTISPETADCSFYYNYFDTFYDVLKNFHTSDDSWEAPGGLHIYIMTWRINFLLYKYFSSMEKKNKNGSSYSINAIMFPRDRIYWGNMN